MEILHRYTNSCLWSGDAETIKDAVENAIKDEANLDGANLDRANLYGANLDGANLYGANLDGANLYGANLNGASLNGASLNGANLDRANLDRANLYGANLDGANLYGANLNGASLYGASLNGANLDRANLYGANLYGANLNGASLNGANLDRANLYGANLDGANLYGAKISRILSIGPLGSRNAYLVAWLMEDGARRYSTGCQVQIEEGDFLARVQERHRDNAHAKAYRAAVEFARTLADGAGRAQIEQISLWGSWYPACLGSRRPQVRILPD